MANEILDLIKEKVETAAVQLKTLKDARILRDLDFNECPELRIPDVIFNELYGNYEWVNDFGEYYYKGVNIAGIYITNDKSDKRPQLEVEDEICE